MLEIPLKILDEQLDGVPKYARPGDAAVDLVARAGVKLAASGGRAQVPTGIAIALPEGFAALVLSRSGLASRHGVCCLNAPGLIDSGYRGELQVVLVNTDPFEDYEVHRGDRVAQLMVIPVDQVAFRSVEDLEATERGEQGFGHTGR